MEGAGQPLGSKVSRNVHVYKTWLDVWLSLSLWLEKPEMIIKFANLPGSKFLLFLKFTPQLEKSSSDSSKSVSSFCFLFSCQ